MREFKLHITLFIITLMAGFSLRIASQMHLTFLDLLSCSIRTISRASEQKDSKIDHQHDKT